MRSSAVLPPLALLTASCALSTSQPAASAWQWDLPASVEVDIPGRDDARRPWILPPGDPWAPYEKYTLFSALDAQPTRGVWPAVDTLPAVDRARMAGARVAAAGLPPGTLWIVDMRGAASVAFGVELSRGSGSVSLVPTFNNWPAENEFVPAEETLAALVALTPRRADERHATTPVFLLDAWRMAYRDDEPDDETYDNRYVLSATDFPDAETLRERGITRVLYVVDGLSDSIVEEEDLHPVMLEWERAGIEIAMVDIDNLLPRESGPWRWDTFWVDWRLHVVPRVTVLQTPGFYVRSHGGFGGARASPSLVGGGHGGWGFGWHGGGG